MGFLRNILGGRHAAVQQLPTGTITVDRNGHIITSTVSSAFPKHLLRDIGRDVLEVFREARVAQMPLAEVSLHYGSLNITARELRGGAIIFIFPQTALLPKPNYSRL